VLLLTESWLSPVSINLIDSLEVKCLSDDTSTPSPDNVEEKRAFATDEDFIASWQGNNSVGAVATALRMKPASVDQRARNMRKHGVPLKPYAAKARTVKDEAYWASMVALANAAMPDDDEINNDA
jgi:hypothetical protein